MQLTTIKKMKRKTKIQSDSKTISEEVTTEVDQITIIDKTESRKCPLGGSRKSWKFDIHCSILLDFYLFYKLRQLPGPASSVSFVNCFQQEHKFDSAECLEFFACNSFA